MANNSFTLLALDATCDQLYTLLALCHWRDITAHDLFHNEGLDYGDGEYQIAEFAEKTVVRYIEDDELHIDIFDLGDHGANIVRYQIRMDGWAS